MNYPVGDINVKILTLNINGYGEKHGKWNTRRDLITEIIKRESPDVVALQACRRDARFDDGIDQVAQLATTLKHYPYSAFMPTGVSSEGVSEGNGFLSKLPLLKTTGQILPLTPKCDDQTLRLVMTGFFDAGRGKTIAIHNCHLSWVDSERISNVTHALPYIRATSAGMATVVVGDFNGTSEREEIRRFEQMGLEDTWRAIRGEEEGYTFESDSPSIRIDYVFTSSELEGEEIALVAASSGSSTRLSDHLGVMVTLGV